MSSMQGKSNQPPRILVLGANKESIQYYELLLAQNVHVLALDCDPVLPQDFLDRWKDRLTCIKHDFSDHVGAAKLARKYGVTHSIAFPVGRALTALGKINDELGLPGASFTAIDTLTHKLKLHKFLESCGIDNYQWIYVPAEKVHSLPSYADEIQSSIGYPCIIKPVTGSGSVGVRMIRSAQDLKSYMAPERFYDDGLLIEQLLKGDEFSCSLLVDNVGKCHLLGLYFKDISTAPYRQETAYFSENSTAVSLAREAIMPLMQKLSSALELRSTFLTADVINSWSGTPYIIDCSARLSGNQVISLHCFNGNNPMQLYRENVIEGKSISCKLPSRACAIRFFDFTERAVWPENAPESPMAKARTSDTAVAFNASELACIRALNSGMNYTVNSDKSVSKSSDSTPETELSCVKTSEGVAGNSYSAGKAVGKATGSDSGYEHGTVLSTSHSSCCDIQSDCCDDVIAANIFNAEELSHIVTLENYLHRGAEYGPLKTGSDLSSGFIMVAHDTVTQADMLALRYLKWLNSHAVSRIA